MKTKQQLVWTLPLVLLVTAFLFITCEKETALSESELSADTEILKKKGKCPGAEIDVVGEGADKKEAEKNLDERADIACYNICSNRVCDGGSCSWKKSKVGKKKTEDTPDGTVKVRAKVTCECDCDDCKGKKNIAQNAFMGTGETKEMAESAAIMAAEEFCKTRECPRYPCDDDEVCLFKKAKVKTSKPVMENGLWKVLAFLESCDCNCGDGPADGTN